MVIVYLEFFWCLGILFWALLSGFIVWVAFGVVVVYA